MVFRRAGGIVSTDRPIKSRSCYQHGRLFFTKKAQAFRLELVARKGASSFLPLSRLPARGRRFPIL